jgi:hypothetical protein
LVIEDKVNIGAEVSIVYEAFSHTVLGNQSVDLGIGEVEIESGQTRPETSLTNSPLSEFVEVEEELFDSDSVFGN